MQFKKVIRRWMINGLGVIVVLLVILEIAMAIVIRSYYYQQVQNSLYTRVNSLSDVLGLYVNEPAFDFETTARNYIETFPDKEKMELQFLDASGNIFASSTGFLPQDTLPVDFKNALENGLIDSNDPRGLWQGTNIAGQKVSAVSMLILDKNGTLYGAIRCVSALDYVDQQITLMISVVVVFGLAVLFFVMLSSSYFVSSILHPLLEIGESAKRIAQGDYTWRIEKQFDDEIGELCDTINNMATEIEESNKLQNEFISSISHELRTPLTAIKGWTETLQQCGTAEGELTQKGLVVIRDEAERLSNMVEELLDFSRLQQSMKVADFERLDLFAEVEETVLLFRERATREGLEIQCVLQEELPPVWGDRARLHQVFANILDNAIKYSNDYGVIRVEAGKTSTDIQLVFSDTGIGISAESLPNVKHKFYRATNLKPGSGIGLAVADEIIRAHNGSLEIESTIGKGTIVTVTLPIIKSEESSVEKSTNP